MSDRCENDEHAVRLFNARYWPEKEDCPFCLIAWLEGLLRMNQICNCCGDHLSEGACKNLDCGRYGANQ